VKIVCAPDSFKESLGAVDAAVAMADGILGKLPGATVDRCPVGDGGEGTLASLMSARPGESVTLSIHNAMGQRTVAEFGLFDAGRLAWLESAAAISLAAIPAAERDVMAAGSYGVGELLLAAAARSPSRIVVGVGGSATNDAGIGMAQALGVRFLDDAGREIAAPITAGMLNRIATIDAGRRATMPAPVEVASDVDNPLTGPHGASAVYGPQKGADASAVAELDRQLSRLAGIIRRDLGIDVETLPGAGAAGGLAAGLVAFAGARITSGVGAVLDAVHFAERVHDAGLCLTGEGRLDGQSLSGKTCIGVARAAAAAGVPVVALVGSVGPGADRALAAGIREVVVIGKGLPAEESIRNAPELLTKAAAEVVARYCR